MSSLQERAWRQGEGGTEDGWIASGGGGKTTKQATARAAEDQQATGDAAESREKVQEGAESIAKLQEERTLLGDQLRVVLEEWEKKGGDPAE